MIEVEKASLVRNSTERAEAGIPVLYGKLEELRILASAMCEAPPPYRTNDHFAFMSLTFLARQTEHAESILLLVKNRLYRDGLLVVRSMIEGMAQLLWATKDPQNQAKRWRGFVYVTDWRTMNSKIVAGETVDSIQRDQIEAGLKEFGDLFLTKKSVMIKSKNGQLKSDPYHGNWTGRTYSDLIKDCGPESGLLRKLYSSLSAWHHWSPAGIGLALRRDGDSVEFIAPSSEDAWTTLATAFQCLFQTAQATDNHLKLGVEERLADLGTRCLEDTKKWMISPAADNLTGSTTTEERQ